MKAGDFFNLEINQGLRDCCVVAVLGDKFLYEYEMPNGTSCMRNERDRPVPYRTLSKRWLEAIDDQHGLESLICRPQQMGRQSTTYIALLEFLREKIRPKIQSEEKSCKT